jgi:uncharacterized repeat protein (TIGR02543 family)
MNAIRLQALNWQNRSVKMLGVIGLLAGLHPALVPAAMTPVGDYATLTNTLAHSADGDTILLTNNITVSAEIAINAVSLTIQGNNYSISVPVPGLDDSGVLSASPSSFRVFNFNATGKTNTLQSLTLKGGAPAIGGGAVLNQAGTLVMQSVTVSQSGGSSNPGGGLYNQGTAFLRDCNLSRNAAGYGGGFLNTATLFLERCTVSENRSLLSNGGGGGGENSGSLYANNCTFANNKSTELGGAINNRPYAPAYFVDCTFVGNVAYNTGSLGGALCNNGGTVSLVNSLFAYNYHFNGSTYDLNDITVYSGTKPAAYYSVFQSTTNQLGSGSVGVTLYTGNSSGSDNSLFCGGATAQVLGPGGSPIGSATVFQPFLAKVGASQTPSAVLQSGSFAIGKGTRAAFSSATATPVVGYYNGSSWVALSGSSPASYEMTTDQNGTSRGGALTVGAVSSTASGLFMLKVNAAANGTVSGGTIYGDIYPAGTTVPLTAIPSTGYRFTEWDYVLGGSGVASTANPYAITLNANITLAPVFSAYTGFTVTYSGNRSTGGSVPAQQVVASGGSATLSGAGTMVRSGYTFLSWNTQSDGTGTNYAPNATYSGTGNLSLYAQWAPVLTTPSVTAWPTASPIACGQTLAYSTLSGGSASVAGNFGFTTPSTAPGLGTAPQAVTFFPSDMSQYSPVSGAVNVTVYTATNGADTWVGNFNANFSRPNWTGQNNPPVSGDSLFFGPAGTAGSTLNVDVGSGTSYPEITFNANARDYTLNGSALIALAAITNNSPYLETLNFPITNAAGLAIWCGGGVTLGGIISGTNAITVSGGPLQLNGSIASSSPVTIASTASLCGPSTAPGTVAVHGQITPNLGTFNTGPETWYGSQFDPDSWVFDGYCVHIDNPSGDAGTDWDLLNISGALAIAATSDQPFIIYPQASFSYPFDDTQDYTWRIATASGGITGFDASKFLIQVDTGPYTGIGFSPFSSAYELNSGQFVVTQSGNDLLLQFVHPASSPVTVYRAFGTYARIPVSAVLASVSDAPGPLTLTAVTSQNINDYVQISGDTVLFAPANPNEPVSTLTYSARLTYGAPAANTFSGTLTVAATNAAGIARSVSVINGQVVLSLAGMPGSKYMIQRSTNLVDWVNLDGASGLPDSITTTAASGNWEFTDPNPPESQAFYRTVQAYFTVLWGNLNTTYNGAPQTVTAASSPPGMTVNVTYYDSGGNPISPPINAGTYTVVGAISEGSFSGSATTTLTIAKAVATITLSDNGDGTATATTTPPGLSVNLDYAGDEFDFRLVDVTATIDDPNYTGVAHGTIAYWFNQ